MMWQPIETAPRDGTEIDLWIATDDGGGYRQPECVWRDKGECEAGWYDAVLEWDRIDAPWTATSAPGEAAMRTATHWMPLPEQPA
jgi:hypothetical protein